MSRLRVPIGPSDHVAGPPDAPVTFVEYGDYQCPYCAAAQSEVARVRETLGDRLRFVFRHFPLSQAHPRAVPAALAAEAAGAQGRFWEMHETLFENQDALDDESLLGFAEALGLDVERFAADCQDERVAERIRRDFLGGARSGVAGTPTFFIDGIRHEGTWSADSLLAALEEAGEPRST